MTLFFVKQNTAYEMRISDWSSDVCSSDLGSIRACSAPSSSSPRWCTSSGVMLVVVEAESAQAYHSPPRGRAHMPGSPLASARCAFSSSSWRCNAGIILSLRSEEHTSELQSLMRISYAVFCLKKKNTNMHNMSRYKHLKC